MTTVLTPSPETSTILATRSGGATLDQDEFGGNPFASSLIELSRRRDLKIGGMLRELRRDTVNRTGGIQKPEWNLLPGETEWTFPLEPGSRSETRIALVLVVSEYASGARTRLAGAAHDERRIASMLGGHGFSVTQGIAGDRASLLLALRSFAIRSAAADVAVRYSTGHGVEQNGAGFLIPGDFPVAASLGPRLLRERAVAIRRISAACKARKINLAFFAGCRSSAE